VRVWISRTAPGADATAARVAALGHEPLVAPVLGVRLLRPDIDLTGVAAIAVTSVHALDALSGLKASHGLPLYAVGPATAAAARAAGFADIVEAGPEAAALAARIAAERPQGVVLHPRAQEAARDLQADLAGAGVEVRAVVAYRTLPMEPSPELAGALAGAADPLDAVLVHSGRGAARVAELLNAAAMAPPLAIAVSASAAQPLNGARVRDILVAESPDDGAMLHMLR
jgi:uroporphyrinogen-III synthase